MQAKSSPSQFIFPNLEREHGFLPLSVRGKLPDALRGTLYRVGPSLLQNHGERYGHWFDGDGAVSAIRLGPEGAEGAIRLVESEGLKEERRAGRRLYGGYGTPRPGGPLARLLPKLKNVANTSVMVWDGRLFALYEPSRPTELDPETLETIGESDLGGVLGPSFSAHPHRVSGRRAWYNFGVRYGKETLLDVYELPDRGSARRLCTVPLAGPTMIHDFIATERHLVFFAPPLRLKVLRQLLGQGTYSENLAWRPELGTEVLVIPIDEPERLNRFTVEPFFQWHFANAFERGEEIVIDYVRYPDFSTNVWLKEAPWGGSGLEALGRYHRAVLSPARGGSGARNSGKFLASFRGCLRGRWRRSTAGCGWPFTLETRAGSSTAWPISIRRAGKSRQSPLGRAPIPRSRFSFPIRRARARTRVGCSAWSTTPRRTAAT